MPIEAVPPNLDWTTPTVVMAMMGMMASGIVWVCREARSYLQQRTTEEKTERHDRMIEEKAEREKFLDYLLEKDRQAVARDQMYADLFRSIQADLKEHTEHSKEHTREHRMGIEELKAVFMNSHGDGRMGGR